VAAKDWQPRTVVDEATASLVNILQALTTAGIWFAIVWLPILVVVGLLVVLVLWGGRRLGLIGRRRAEDVPLAG
jgi:fatty acid desaturase